MKVIKYPELVAEMARHGEERKDLAKYLDIAYHALWRRMIGKTEWTNSEIQKVCEHYGKSYEELFK